MGKSRTRLTQEEAEQRVIQVLSDTPYVLSSPLVYKGCRDTQVNLFCKEHNYSWNTSWTELCLRTNKRDKYCGCKICKLSYTKETCHRAALQCKYRSDFASKFKGEYFAALRNGWLDEICAHMPHIGNRYNRCIYVYEFLDIDGYKYAYVGLTDHAEKRDKMHGRKGTLFNFCKEHGVVRPEMKLLTGYLPTEEAQRLEGEYLQKYIDEGWLPINLKKTGGLGGNIRFSGYSFEECKQIGSQYTSRSEWKQKDYSSYYIASKFGWIDKIIEPNERWSNQGAYWTKERIKGILANYASLVEFRHSESAAYAIACREGWCDELFASIRHKVAKYNFTIEQIKESLNHYATTTDFVEAEPAMYNWCMHHKIRLTQISDKPVRKISYNRKAIFQYTLDGTLVAEYSSAREAAKEGFDYKKISLVCQGKRKSHNGYIFSFSPDGVTPVEHLVKRDKSIVKKKRLSKYVPKRVLQYTIDGIFMHEYASTREASELTGISAKAIQGNVAHKTHTACGYIFRYQDDSSEVKSRANVKSPRSIPILQYELDGTFVKEWPSIRDAEVAMYTNGKGHITEVCKGKRPSAKGFIWKYKEPQ